MLYPIKFRPRLKERIWGGSKLAATGKRPKTSQNKDRIGESWEISGIYGEESVVSNGFLKNNNLQEITEVYMGDLVGEKVFERFDSEFPVLVKFIDARDRLSIQVHPDDDLAEERHGCRGKNEFWYIVDAEPGAHIWLGFRKGVTHHDYHEALHTGEVHKLLNMVPVKAGDIFIVPAGTVHSIGEGIFLAEIQETSDIIYRIDDWGRLDDNGEPRELSLDEAHDAIDFEASTLLQVQTPGVANKVEELFRSSDYVIDKIVVRGRLERDTAPIDSFFIYICTSGEVTITTPFGSERLRKAQTLLIPAEESDVVIEGEGDLLEVYMQA